jgi:hypothetical protein
VKTNYEKNLIAEEDAQAYELIDKNNIEISINDEYVMA